MICQSGRVIAQNLQASAVGLRIATTLLQHPLEVHAKSFEPGDPNFDVVELANLAAGVDPSEAKQEESGYGHGSK
ncbi:hypothetical protein [Litoreibacter halocynthiae]|uniref:hypothetical protein n=1 Tax=Litoreibacter halocynthiae TaxID=1242689 RepID=UPI003D7CE81C